MHTPGPWTAYNAHGSTILRNWRIEERNTTPGIGRPVATVANEDTGRSGDEQVANARLIAASPDLLDLLTESLMYVEECEEYHKESCRTLSKRIRAAIEAINPTK